MTKALGMVSRIKNSSEKSVSFEPLGEALIHTKEGRFPYMACWHFPGVKM